MKFRFIWLTLLAISCNKQDITLSEKNAVVTTINSSDVKTTPTALQLSKDNDFIKLNNLNKPIIGNSDAPSVEYLDGGYISPAELQSLARALGYSDSTALRSGLNYQTTLVANLQSKYYLSEAVVVGAYNLLNTTQPQPCTNCGVLPPGSPVPPTQQSNIGIITPNNAPHPCLAAYNSCISTANSSYTWHIVECTGAAIGASTVVTPLGGLLFQIGCGGAAIYILHQDRKACLQTYQGCN